MLFVADEVICGFGRTGNVWGCQTLNIKPDILTCAKALSASFLPISAVMMNEKVYQALMRESDKIGTWGHGFTYSGHPVAAAVALEAQKIYDEMRPVRPRQAHEPGVPEAPAVVRRPSAGRRGDGRRHGGRARDRRRQEDQGAVRPRLTVGAGNNVYNHAVARGLFIRNMGDRIAICPPLIINETELADLFGRLRQSIDAAMAELKAEGHFKG